MCVCVLLLCVLQYLGTYASEEAAHQALDTYRKLQASLISLQQ
jgi:hypothetical protein